MSDIVDFSFYTVENLAQAWTVVGDGSRPAARTEGKHTCIPRKKSQTRTKRPQVSHSYRKWKISSTHPSGSPQQAKGLSISAWLITLEVESFDAEEDEGDGGHQIGLKFVWKCKHQLAEAPVRFDDRVLSDHTRGVDWCGGFGVEIK